MFSRVFHIFFTILKFYFLELPKEARIRKILEELGGAFVKFGQILALRSDLVSENLALELLHLLDEMPQIPEEKIRQIIEQELGRPAEEVFSSFDKAPLASASFAQVYRACTWNNEQVIVKIQRPGMAEVIRIDIKIFYCLAWLLDFFGYFGPLRPKQAVKEFSKWTLLELDYLREAKMAEYFKLHAPPGVKIPKVFWSLTTKNILVEEYMEGISLKQLLINKPPSFFNPKLISSRLIENIMHQYFILGQFHGDPHAGNIIISRDNALNLVDFGIVGQNTFQSRIAMAHFVQYAMNKDYNKAFTAFLHLGAARQLQKHLPYLINDKGFMDRFMKYFPVFKTILSKKFARITGKWHKAIISQSAAFSEKSAAKTFLKFLKMAGIYRITVSSEIVLFIKTLIAADALSLKINPEFNLAETINRVFKQPEYAELFSMEAKFKLIEPLKTTLPKKNSEKTESLKDYYAEWFYQIMEKHKKEFSNELSKQELLKSPVRLADEPIKPGKVPDWLIKMRQALLPKQ